MTDDQSTAVAIGSSVLTFAGTIIAVLVGIAASHIRNADTAEKTKTQHINDSLRKLFDQATALVIDLREHASEVAFSVTYSTPLSASASSKYQSITRDRLKLEMDSRVLAPLMASQQYIDLLDDLIIWSVNTLSYLPSEFSNPDEYSEFAIRHYEKLTVLIRQWRRASLRQSPLPRYDPSEYCKNPIKMIYPDEQLERDISLAHAQLQHQATHN